MNRAIVVLFFAAFATYSQAQNIYTAVHHQRKESLRAGKAKRIEEVNTYYGDNGSSTSKNIKILNKHNLMIQQESFENSKLVQRYKAAIDSLTGQKVWRTLERWHPVLGYNIEKAVYHYDSKGFHTGVTHYNASGQKVNETIIQVNEKGHPIELAVYDTEGNLLGGIERAQYLYEKNRYVSTVLSADGRELSKDTAVIDFEEDYRFQQPGKEFNPQGDLIKSHDTPEGYNWYEYKYDTHGNWLEEKKYEVKRNKNGKEKRKLVYVRTRKIEYWEE
jgi:hypothetical protein